MEKGQLTEEEGDEMRLRKGMSGREKDGMIKWKVKMSTLNGPQMR